MIVKMLHLDLVCLAAEKDKTLTQLRDLGAVHLDLSSAQGAPSARRLIPIWSSSNSARRKAGSGYLPASGSPTKTLTVSCG